MGSKKKKGGVAVSASTQEKGGKDFVEDATVEVEKLEMVLDETVSKVTKKSRTTEIDEIFGNKKRKVVAGQSRDTTKEMKTTQEMKKTKKKVVTQSQPSADNSGSTFAGKPRKKTLDGYKVYSEEEIGWNRRNAGGTPLCPFDCDCCF